MSGRSGRTCTVCRHAERAAIDEALVGGTPFRNVAERHGLKVSSLFRHRKEHVSRALVKVEEARRGAEDETLLDKVKALEADAHRLKRKAEDEGDIRAALVAIDKLLEIVRLYGELTPAKPSPADVERTLAWTAEEIGCTVDELRASCEEHARIQAEILAGRNPPHRERPALPSPPTVLSAIEDAAKAAREPVPSPAPPAPAPPPARPWSATV